MAPFYFVVSIKKSSPQVGYFHRTLALWKIFHMKVFLEVGLQFTRHVLAFQVWSREIVIDEVKLGTLEADTAGVKVEMGSGQRGIKLRL